MSHRVIDGSRSTGGIPVGGNNENGVHTQDQYNLANVDDVLTQTQSNPDEAGDDSPGDKAVQFNSPQTEKKDHRVFPLSEKKLSNLDRTSAAFPFTPRNQSDDDRDDKYPDPYPRWNPAHPDPEHTYCGFLYRIDSRGREMPLEYVESMDFTDISLQYGRGRYAIHLYDANGPSFQFEIPLEFYRNAVRNNPDRFTEIQREKKEFERLERLQNKALTAEDEQPKKDDVALMSVLVQGLIEKNKNQPVAPTNSGASIDVVLTARTNGYNEGVASQQPLIEILKIEKSKIERELQDARDLIEELQEELGQLPSDTGEEEEPPKEKNFLDQASEVLDKIQKLSANNQAPAQENKPAQIEQKVEIKSLNTDDLKKVVIGVIARKFNVQQGTQAISEVIAKLGFIEKNVIEGQLKTATAQTIVDYLVKNFMPQATADNITYLTGVVSELKKRYGA